MSATSAQLQADLERRGYTVALSNGDNEYTCVLTVGPNPVTMVGYGATQEEGETNALRNARRAAGIPDTELTYEEYYAIIHSLPTHDYGDVDGPVAIDMSNGPRQKLTVIATLSADDITLTTPSSGSRKVTLEVIQGGAGGFVVPASAWPSNANFGTKGAPDLDEVAGARWFLVLDFEDGDSDVLIHYDTNFF